MKKVLYLLVLALMLTGTVYALQANPLKPVVKPETILKDGENFSSYLGFTFKPHQPFIAYSTKLKSISKLQFLQKLNTGSYLPLEVSNGDGKLRYQLYLLKKPAYQNYGDVVMAFANQWLNNYKKEGKKFPAFSFKDINGNVYNTANTKGKTLIIKCWFIGCQRCEEEMPELNDLKARYRNRKDLVFISLAPDSKSKLQAFLKRKRFDYPIIPNQQRFMSDRLGVMAYPSHFIVNKQGVIVNVVDSPEDIDWALLHLI